MRIVECVPNFSEGRRKEVIDAIANAIRSTPNITLLDVEYNADHNRSVITFVGEPESVKLAALAGPRRPWSLSILHNTRESIRGWELSMLFHLSRSPGSQWMIA